MVIVFSPTTRAGGPFISSSGSGRDRGTEGFGVVRRGLKRLHHQWSLQMAAHAQTSQPKALGQLQHTMIFKQAGLKHSNQKTPNRAPPTGGITAIPHTQLNTLLCPEDVTQAQPVSEKII